MSGQSLEVSLVVLGGVAFRGSMDNYFESMNGALEEHVIIATEVMHAPLLAKAREDPRYQELLAKLRKQNGL